MPESSRPATLQDLRTLARALAEQRTPYLLIGGWALLVLPDQAARDIDAGWFEEGATIRVADEFVVDVMFRACGETYESLLPFARQIDLDGIPVSTVSLEGLLKTKQSLRDKDALDRVVIERALAQSRDSGDGKS